MRYRTIELAVTSKGVQRRLSDSPLPVRQFRVRALADNTNVVTFGERAVAKFNQMVGTPVYPGEASDWIPPTPTPADVQEERINLSDIRIDSRVDGEGVAVDYLS